MDLVRVSETRGHWHMHGACNSSFAGILQILGLQGMPRCILLKSTGRIAVLIAPCLTMSVSYARHSFPPPDALSPPPPHESDARGNS
jgi:hypothetical protein